MGKLNQLKEAFRDFITLKYIRKARRRQVLGMAVGIFLSTAVFVSLQQTENEAWLSKGPFTPGHGELSCNSCHQEAEGSIRQQLQAKLKFQTGFRHTDADFGLKKVENASCLSCHERPDDHHPTFRFNEPRFAEVRKTLDATRCGSCHTEHKGTLASVAETTICSNCHQDLKIKQDPLELSHEELIGKSLWSSCMQCHDYHGNHKMEVATSLKDTIPVEAIITYLRKGTDPFSTEKIKKASINDGK